MATLGNAATLLTPEPEERGIQIRTLREHELNNVRAVEVPGCTPWKPSGWRKNPFGITAPSAKEDCNPGTWVFASGKDTQRSCSSGAKHTHAMVCNSTSSASSASVNVTRSADVEDRTLLCRQQENHSHSCEGVLGSVTINFGSSISTGAVTSTQTTSAAGSAMTTTAEDGIYDPEELLLEPLLSSPRSDRERRARSSSESGPGNCTYENNMLHDARVMSHCIGSNHQVPVGMSARRDGEMSSPSSGIVSSAMHSSSFLSRPLVPVSPSLSGAQGSSFIPGGDQSPRSCAVEGEAVAGAGGGVVGDNGTWYLNFPPGNQQHQRYQSHLHHASTSAVASAARLAAEAANVAAAIQQATGPFSAHHIGSSYTPPCANDLSVGAMGMRTSDANNGGGGGSSACNGESGGGLVGSGGGICSADYHHYPDESRTSWSTTSVSTPTWQPPAKGAPGRTSSGGQTGGTPQRPRFVTREECVPGPHHTHGDPEWLVPFGAVEGSRSRTPGIQQMHSLANNSLYARSANHDLGGGNGGGKRMKVLGAEDVSQGWINLPRSAATSASVGITAGSNRTSSSSSNGWRSSGLSIRANGGNAVTAESSPSSDASTAVPDSATPRRHSGRTHVSASSADSAARADLDQSLPEGRKHRNSDDDSTVGITESVGDSSPEWADREESEEEIKAQPRNKGDSKGSSGGGGSGGSKSSKVPFMLDPKLWVIVERRAVCSAKQCAYRSEDDHRARRRHYHALCSHVHQNGERKGMRFQHHQNTQRTNVGKTRSPTGSPTPRNKRSSAIHGMKEQSRAIRDANLEAHTPKDWTPELTQRLRDLVDELGPKWSAVAEKIPGKTATACMLHWRVSLNPNHMVKGSGTWTAEEDERLSKLVEVVGMKWSDLARHIPGRIAKQCRERYLNHLDPSLRKDMPWTEDEEALLMRLCFAKQNQWAEICRQLHGRSYNDVKNRFNLIQRRNKRAQGSHSPATSSPPTLASSALMAYKSTRAEQQPSRRGAKNATRTTSSVPVLAPAPSSSAAAVSSSSSVSDSSYTSSCGNDVSYHGSTMPRARGVCSSSSSSSAAMAAVAAVQTPVIFAPATAGWGSTPASAPAPAPTSSSTNSFLFSASSAATVDRLYEDHRAVAQSGVGHAPSHAQQQQNATSSSEPSSSSFDLIGDELGEFGIDGPESGSPGSGFAPGGYWHQMVKEESRMARGSDDEGVHDGIDEDDDMGERSEDGRAQSDDLPVRRDGDLADARRWGAIGPVSGDDDVRLIKVDPSLTTTVARFPQNGLPLP